jgi:polyisoprenoid-binding protein YceI
MKKYILTLIAVILFPLALLHAQHYTPVEESSAIKFSVVNHLIGSSTVNGTLKGLKGTIIFDPANLNAASFNVSVSVNTISTGIGMRDNDLQKEKYFNQSKYQLIALKSQSITKGTGKDQYTLTASLTIRGVTKTISFPFTAIPSNGGYLFKGQFQLNRMDYNLGPDNAIDKKVSVDLSVLAK